MIKDFISSQERMDSINNYNMNYVKNIIKRDVCIYMFLFLIFVLFILSVSKNIGA